MGKTASFTQEFGKGFSAYGEAHRVMMKHGLMKYLLIPGFATLLYAVLFFFIAYRIADGFSTNPDAYPWFLSWMGKATEWVVKFLYWPLVVFVFIFSYKTLTQIVLSPVLSHLSEVVEHREFNGELPKSGFAEAISDIQRSLLINFRNLFHELLYCFLAGFVPLVGSILAFGISSYYTGFNFMDYTMERHRMSLKQSVAFVHEHRGLASGLGMMCMLGMMIPVVGWFFMPTYATVASTLQTYRLLKAQPFKT